MDVFEAINKRYSCRNYRQRPVEPEKLEKILDAARLAPSARNLQDWRFVVVSDPAKKALLVAAANGQEFVGQAPVVIVACSRSNYFMRCGQPVGTVDVSIALEHIALAATALGLATCWIGSFFPQMIREILDIPSDAAIIELMTLGYPADSQPPIKRNPLETIVNHDCWKKDF